ncbi:MAG TPA: ROK family protein [Bacteroidota bacterium]|nr:ROK family protein [Bacteroidota bacterium]
MGKRIVLGVDIGGTNTKLGFVDNEGNILAHTSIATNAHNPADEFFNRLNSEAEKLHHELPKDLELVGIGIGSPNGNYFKGTIEHPPNLSWGYVNVVQLLRQWYDIPIAITNDANAAALGEMQFGAAKGMKHFIEITLGTGLGSGIVVDGTLVYGHDGFAGEIGHTIVDPNGRLCGCGRQGCLETYASAGGICRTVEELKQLRSTPSVIRSIPIEELTSKKVFEAAEAGDELAREAFEFTGKILGMKLADSVAHTSPEAIILFGGVAEAGEWIFAPTRRWLEHFLFPIFRNKVKLLHSGLPRGSAAILGSAALIWNEIQMKR